MLFLPHIRCLSHALTNTRKCYVDYIEAKVGRRLGALAKDTRTTAKPERRRYIAGISFGTSSTAMTQALAKFCSPRKSSAAFELHAVHVDTNLTEPLRDGVSPAAQRNLDKYRERFSNVSFQCVHLSKVLNVGTIDWSSLPCFETISSPEVGSNCQRLQNFFNSLPSPTSRAYILRLLIRHILLDMALETSSTALLLGHSTTALAALTLSEVANGRGYSVPWQINDGPYTFCVQSQKSDSKGCKEMNRETQVHIYYPMRELFAAEISQYLGLVSSLQELVSTDTAGNSRSVVSHKDVSIDDIMNRYFSNVEGQYEGVVANVVRTTGRLSRVAGSDFCRLCGITLDDNGDSRWAGSLGHDSETNVYQHILCYGCKRCVRG
ncbi:hypothetical protein DCS_03691 [Drechmeria coniospora]|uniref:Cytoplasmic tRNA 2-thiolation protein 2 n=1 Tax=Drechmeria coniospora TaxID=98403 RepID=A0A151GHZ2_DRECN|nr:hypothetical protein DCS_03691 [Drechmeria coniospora]KYK56689.1 hypothetical protein DCS_03691 [Drechmeria coniospora]